MLQHLQRLHSCRNILVSRLGLVKASSHIAWRGLFRLWVRRRRFWYSESSVAADKPDNLSSAPRLADNYLLTLAYAAGDLGYAVGESKDGLFDETCSSLCRLMSVKLNIIRDETHLRDSNTEVLVSTHDSTSERFIEDVRDTRTNVSE